MKKPAVSIIIVTRNGKEVTRQCLESLIPLSQVEVIIVDNHSSDGTLAMLRSWKKFPLHIISNQTNTGFAQANNQGFAAAGAEYILFLNNDTIVGANFLKPLRSYLQSHPKVAAVQPVILFPDGTIDSIGSYFTPTGFLYHRAHRMLPSNTFLLDDAVYSLKGACMLWRTDVLRKIGVFDEHYFSYFEETELCHRAIRAGYRVCVVRGSNITHLGGYTSNRMQQSLVQYHNTKNRIATYLRHFDIQTLWRVLGVHLVLTELMIVRTIFSRPLVALAMQRGVIMGCWYGIWQRGRFNVPRKPVPTKVPDVSYYLALFSSLKGYAKVW